MATRGRIDDLGAGSSITHARHKKGLDATKGKLKLGKIIGTKYWELKIVKNDLKARKRLSPQIKMDCTWTQREEDTDANTWESNHKKLNTHI